MFRSSLYLCSPSCGNAEKLTVRASVDGLKTGRTASLLPALAALGMSPEGMTAVSAAALAEVSVVALGAVGAEAVSGRMVKVDNDMKHVVGISYATIILAEGGKSPHIHDEGNRYRIHTDGQKWQAYSGCGYGNPVMRTALWKAQRISCF